MTRSACLVAVVLSLAVAAGLATSRVGAQPAPAAGGVAIATKVAVVLPSRIIAEMQEAKDSTERLKNEAAVLTQKYNAMKEKATVLQDQYKLLKPETTQAQDKMRELVEASINLKATGEILQREAERSKRTQLKALYDKIVVAVEKVAKQKGYDIVLADQHATIPDVLPEDTTEQTLTNAIRTRSLMYYRPEVDITTDVIAALDAEYKK